MPIAPAANKLLQIWESLLDRVEEKIVYGKRYCAAPSLQGSRYSPGGIAVIGRAPNGWAFSFTKEEFESIGRAALAHRIVNVHVCSTDNTMVGGKSECGPMHWIVHPYHYRGATRVNARIGKFWPMIAEVTKKLLGDNASGWEESIAWTNLYPFSNEFGNPDSKLATAQRAASAELLRTALGAWKPRTALFVTETNSRYKRTVEWSEPFHAALGVVDLELRNDGAVIAAGRLADHDTKVLLVARPDARQGVRYDFASDLVRMIES